MSARSVALVGALMLASACGSGTTTGSSPSAPTSTTASAPTTTSARPTPTTTAPTTTTARPTPVEDLLVIGDSIAGQLFWALDQRSRVRRGPRIEYLLTAGPRFADDWPEPMPRFIDDPAATAVMVSFGVWHATPPEQVADLVDELSDTETLDATVDFLRPIADQRVSSATVYLLTDIDEPQADARIQAANRQIAAAADEVGLPVRYLLSGRGDDGPATVSIDGHDRPVRNGADATHFCAAAALVMADEILDELGLAPRALTLDDVDDLLEAAADTAYFTTEGCD